MGSTITETISSSTLNGNFPNASCNSQHFLKSNTNDLLPVISDTILQEITKPVFKHNSKSSLKCRKCNKIFSNKSNRRRHEKKFHKLISRQDNCLPALSPVFQITKMPKTECDFEFLSSFSQGQIMTAQYVEENEPAQKAVILEKSEDKKFEKNSCSQNIDGKQANYVQLSSSKNARKKCF